MFNVGECLLQISPTRKRSVLKSQSKRESIRTDVCQKTQIYFLRTAVFHLFEQPHCVCVSSSWYVLHHFGEIEMSLN
jgi:hypothetical protein